MCYNETQSLNIVRNVRDTLTVTVTVTETLEFLSCSWLSTDTLHNIGVSHTKSWSCHSNALYAPTEATGYCMLTHMGEDIVTYIKMTV